MSATAIELTIDPRERSIGSAVVRRVLPYRHRRIVGPFIFADIFGPDDYEAGAGSVAGIGAGDVNWMTAGSGVCHTERTPPTVRRSPHSIAGLQTWVALPVEYEQQQPGFDDADAADRDLIDQAKRDWDAQRFPLIPGDHDVWVPAPEQ